MRDLRSLLTDLDWDKEGNLINRQTKESVISAEWYNGPTLLMPEELQNFFITNQYGALLDKLAALSEENAKLLAVVEVAKELYYMGTNFGNYENGNTCMGIDEGKVMAGKVFGKFEKALA